MEQVVPEQVVAEPEPEPVAVVQAVLEQVLEQVRVVVPLLEQVPAQRARVLQVQALVWLAAWASRRAQRPLAQLQAVAAAMRPARPEAPARRPDRFSAAHQAPGFPGGFLFCSPGSSSRRPVPVYTNELITRVQLPTRFVCHFRISGGACRGFC